MDDCFLHFESVKEDALSTLNSTESWKTILNAAKIREYSKILELNENLPDGKFPNIKFHKSCRAMFTMKRDLKKSQTANKIYQVQVGKVHVA